MPSWFPGARYKRHAREWYPGVVGAVNTPYDKVKSELVSVAGSLLITTSDLTSGMRYLGIRNGNSLCRSEHRIET